MKTQNSVLVIDDEQIICDSCNRILTKENLKVDTDTNPLDGFVKAAQNDYDVILLDLNMKELDGIKLLHKLRETKPNVPVIVITGYPTKETKEESEILGVNDYILKPFKPDEILVPVRKVLNKYISAQKSADQNVDFVISKWEASEKYCNFYKNSWLQKGKNNIVKIGGQFPVFLSEQVIEIKTAQNGECVYAGFPLAEICFENNVKFIVPSPVSGKIIELNTELIENPARFELCSIKENWLVALAPDYLQQDFDLVEKREVVLLSENLKSDNKYYKQIENLGYIVNTYSSLNDAVSALKHYNEKVVVLDAKSFAGKGSELFMNLKDTLPDTKVIVFNKTNSEEELIYRQMKVFYYAVDPIVPKEISSILYGAFCFAADKEVIESNRITFLPQLVSRVHITNKHGRKVTLLAFDNLLRFNKGVGFLLLQKLHNNLFPIEIDHIRTIKKFNAPETQQVISKEKLKNDKIIILMRENNLNKIPGSIDRISETFENSIAKDKTLVKLVVNTLPSADDVSFDTATAKALATLIENEMISI